MQLVAQAARPFLRGEQGLQVTEAVGEVVQKGIGSVGSLQLALGEDIAFQPGRRRFDHASGPVEHERLHDTGAGAQDLAEPPQLRQIPSRLHFPLTCTAIGIFLLRCK